MYPTRSASAFACCILICSILAPTGGCPNVAMGQDVPVAKVSPNQPPGWVIVEAEDQKTCRLTGKFDVYIYPRSVARQVVMLFPGSRLEVTTDARAVHVRLPAVFSTPGPRYWHLADSRIRVQIDQRPWQEIALATARLELPLATDLPPGEHRIVVEPVGEYAGIDGFRFASRPLSSLVGTILSNGYAELLTDVRAEVFAGDKLVRTEYVRQPCTGQFELWGLEPGTYRLRITAAGWEPRELSDLVIRQGEQVDLGTIGLTREPACGGLEVQGCPGPRFGRSVSTAPGEDFTALVNFLDRQAFTARLVSRFKSIDIPVADIQKLDLGVWNDVGTARFHIPESTPHDMYDLALTRATAAGEQTMLMGQAVAVREKLPASFHVAGIGHMNTWGQQTAEYLGRVAQVAELAGARTLLISNEVNAAYVAGAVRHLRIPYLVTWGNHTMPRWDEFFGSSSLVHDDGPMRIVTFGRWPYESWHEAGRLIKQRSEATNRILLCYEGYAPIDLIRDGQVDLLFDGHSDAQHPDRQSFPPGTFHMRAPTQETIRWIPMTHGGLAPEMRASEDVPVLNVPREGPAPLRLEFAAANDGTATQQKAVITNEYPIRFPHARVRFVLKQGKYQLNGGVVLQQFDSDDRAKTVLDAEVDVAAKGTATLSAEISKE